MAIAVTCGRCRSTFQAKDADAGRRGKCPRCEGDYARLWGRLAALAEDVEAILALARLAEPPEPANESD